MIHTTKSRSDKFVLSYKIDVCILTVLSTCVDYFIFRAPSIIVMDDIDSMFPNREKTQNEALRRLVSTLLTLMDGISSVSRWDTLSKSPGYPQ